MDNDGTEIAEYQQIPHRQNVPRIAIPQATEGNGE
jgi:hypothetical protein